MVSGSTRSGASEKIGGQSGARNHNHIGQRKSGKVLNYLVDSLVLITEPDWFLLALWSVREATKRESMIVAQSDSFEKRDPLRFF